MKLITITDQSNAPVFAQWLNEKFGLQVGTADTRFIASAVQDENGVELVGVTAFNKWTSHTVEAHAASDGSKRQKINRRYIWTCFDYAFNQADKSCLICHIAVDNVRSLALTEQVLGFKRLCEIEDYYGEGRSAYLLTVTKKQWLAGPWAHPGQEDA